MNPYSVLEVSKDASQAEIKKAYKSLAKKYHPDNSESASPEKFKEVSEAYEKIGDPEKRKHYDAYGDTKRRASSQSYSFYGDMESIFESFFNEGRKKRAVGDNIQVAVSCTLEEVMTGCEKTVEYRRKEICDDCTGTGAKTKKKCDVCDGSGHTVRQNANIAIRSLCPACAGDGEIIDEVCGKCAGVGLTGKRAKTVDVKIPAGVEHGMRLTFRGEGDPGPAEGLPGNLYLVVHIEKHEFFARTHGDLSCTVPITYSQLINGAKLKIATLEGVLVEFTVPPKAGIHSRFRLSGQGLPIYGSNSSGDIIITLDIEVPDELDEEYQDIISKLAEKEAKYSTKMRNDYEKYLAAKTGSKEV